MYLKVDERLGPTGFRPAAFTGVYQWNIDRQGNLTMPGREEVCAADEDLLDALHLIDPVEKQSAFEYSVRSADGRLKWLRIVATCLLDGGFSCIAVDITAQKNAESALAATSRNYRSLLADTTRGVLCWNSDAIVIEANDKAAEILGTPIEQLIGTTAASPAWRRGQTEPGGICPCALALQTGQPLSGLEVSLEIDGEERILEIDILVEFVSSGSRPDRMYSVLRDITEKKRSWEALEETTARLAAAQSSAQLGSWELFDGEKTGFWSDEMYRLFRWDRTKPLPTLPEFLELVEPADRSQFDAAHRLVLNQGRGASFDFGTNPALGPHRWFRANIRPLRRGRRSGMCGTVFDITPRKLAAQKSRAESEREADVLRRVVARAPIGIVMFDRELRCVQASQRWVDDCGLESTRLAGKPYTELLPAFPAPWKEYFRRGLSGETLRGTRTRFVIADGQERFVNWEIQPWGDSGVTTGGIILYSEDVTEQNRWETALRASEERWQFALQGSGDGVWDWNAVTNETFFSPQFKRILGYNDADFPNRHESWATRVHPDDKERVVAALQNHLQRRTASYISEHRMLCKDGQYRWVMERGRVVSRSLDGKPMRVIGTCTDISERKQNEAEIRSLARLFEALSSVNQAIVRRRRKEDLFDEVTRVLVQCAGFSGTQIRHTDPLSGEETVAERGEIGPESPSIDLPIRCGGTTQGTLRVFHESGARFQSRDLNLIEEIAEDLSFAVDLLERDRRRLDAEQALRLSETRLAAALNAAELSIWDSDLKTGRQLFAGRLDQLFGIDRRQIESWQEVLKYLHPDDVAPIEREALHAMANRRPLEVECRSIWPDGSVHWLSGRGEFLYDAQGNPIRMLGVVGDITQRKGVEASLAATIERLSLAQIAGEVGCFDYDVKSRRLYWTPELEKLQGFAPGTFPGTPEAVYQNIHPDDLPKILSRAEQWQLGGSRDEFTHRIFLPSGEVRWIEVRADLIRDAEGKVVRVVGTNSDITARMRAAEEKQKLELQLIQAQKMESVGRLAGGIAHDFNNLLTVIRGYSDLLLATAPPDDPDRASIEEIFKAGDRATVLVRQLLAFSRKQVLAKEVLDLDDVVGQAGKMLGRLVGEDIELSIRLGGNLPRILADRHQLEQVILNLAVNARDAMPEGGVLTIETAAPGPRPPALLCLGEMNEVPCARMTIRDTGTGIPAEVLAHLFEPFFTTKESGKGTGLGLATVQGIVLQTGGHLCLATEVGVGSAFHIYFPVVEAKEEPRATAAITEYPRGNETILLVEDQEAVRRFAEAVLQGCGYRVYCAANGDEAIAVIEHHNDVDLVLTDIVMPRLSGNHLAAWVKEHHPDIELLLMTGYADKTASAGLDDKCVIQKPFSPEALTKKVREVLGPLRPRVLVLGDDDNVRRYLETALRQGGCRPANDRGGSVADRLRTQRPDVVVADLPLGAPGEAALAEYARLHPGKVIGVSSVERRDFDCVLAKPVTSTDLVAAVTRIAGQKA